MSPDFSRFAATGIAVESREKGGQMRRLLQRVILVMSIPLAGYAPSAVAQELSGLARLNAAASQVRDDGAGIAIDLALSQPVPWRVLTLHSPPRLVLDFREVAWQGVDLVALAQAETAGAGRVTALRSGVFRPGWSRLVLEMDGPYAVTAAVMDTSQGGARVMVRLQPVSLAEFAAMAGAPASALWDLPAPALVEPGKLRQRGEGPLVVVLDAGHGGIDPGAERDGLTEAALMLTFARELREMLVRTGGFRVVMSREEDVFVPLETRISVAHAVGSDVFLSLHADAIAEGVATGATIYTLAAEASDAASAALAERHDRADLLAGVDLSGQDDVIAAVLMEMARTETSPRADRLADTLVAAIQAAGLRMHKRPRLFATFSVLKSPDIPSVLLELGFLSSANDLTDLQDPDWRARMQAAVVTALQAWAVADAAEAGLLRR